VRLPAAPKVSVFVQMHESSPDRRGSLFVVDACVRQESVNFRHLSLADEQDRLAEISDAFLLDETRVSVSSPIGPSRVAVDESINVCRGRAILAVYVPCDDEAGIDRTLPHFSHPGNCGFTDSRN